MFEGLDGTAAGAPTYGPNPVGSCKGGTQWNDANTFAPGAVSGTASVIDGFDLSGGTLAEGRVNVTMNLRTTFLVNNVAANTVVMCTTPGGATFVGQGGGIAAAVTNMQLQTVPFSGIVTIEVTRNNDASTNVVNAVGLARRVIVPGGGTPRIRSVVP